jgi:hypothetical protein
MVSYTNLKCEVSRWKVWNLNVKFERYKNLEGNGVLHKPQMWTLFWFFFLRFHVRLSNLHCVLVKKYECLWQHNSLGEKKSYTQKQK